MIIGILGCGLDEKGNPVSVKRVGKDTFADELKSLLYSRYGYEIHLVSFAKCLKYMVCRLYNLKPHEVLWCKEKPIIGDKSFRDLLELFGSDVIRETLSLTYPKLKTLWIDKCIEQIKENEMDNLTKGVQIIFNTPLDQIGNDDFMKLKDKFVKVCKDMKMPPFPPPVKKHIVNIVTDVRYPSEYKALKDLGCVFVQIRRNLTKGQLANISSHSSDTVYSEMVPDFTIDNNGTLEDLELKVRKLWKSDLQTKCEQSSLSIKKCKTL